MKNISFKAIIFCLVALRVFTSCGDSGGKKSDLPAPGAIVAADEIQITEDTLNHSSFKVQVIADSNVKAGVYMVKVTYGLNRAHGLFTMPKGGETFIPLIKKGNTPNTFIIGFKVPNDTTFHDYFLVSSDGHATKMQYMKSYSYE